MSHNSEDQISKDEIKKEFQLERMILFSDAVFAIVITLMAIEIKIPETSERLEGSFLKKELLHLVPVVSAYAVSFFFIGSIWYQHLKIFSLLKDYDKGLVVRNLLLLFFVGLFPFSASLITRTKGTSIAFFIYLGIILCCMISQFVLQHYIVIKRPGLRINTNFSEHLKELKKRQILVIGFLIAFILCVITFTVFKDPDIRSFAPLWILPVIVIYRFLGRKKK
jgi:TMEM175 potassium channel family protein